MAELLTPIKIEHMAISSIKQAYSKLRSAANKRLARMEAAGIGNYGSARFAKISEMSTQELYSNLADVSRFMNDPRTTVRGQRRYMSNMIDSFNQQGYYWIDESNLYDFLDYMDDLRDQYSDKMFDSGDAVDVYNEAQRLNVSSDILKKHFDYFQENLDAMEEIKPIKKRNNKAVSFSDIKRKIERYNER